MFLVPSVSALPSLLNLFNQAFTLTSPPKLFLLSFLLYHYSKDPTTTLPDLLAHLS